MVPWNKGKHLSEEHKKHLSIAHKGITTSRRGEKIDRSKYPTMGHFTKHSVETKRKISLSKLGKPNPNKGKKYSVKSRVGLNHRELDYRERRRFRMEMQKQVFERDNYTCQLCGSKKDLQVDHIQPWAEYVELRFSMDNCRTLCAKCHYFITFNKPMPENLTGWGHNLLWREEVKSNKSNLIY